MFLRSCADSSDLNTNASPFERAHLHGFVNTLFQKNLDDDDLMAAFDGYGKEAFCT